jgi:hypothetical protein
MACLVWATAAFAGEPTERMELGDFMLFAHRGVVTETIQANSLAALDEAIARGYSHMEVDIGATKDGHAVCIHDDSLRKAGLPQRVSELTLGELRALVPEEAVASFATLCARSEGRIGLMVDIKWVVPGVEEAFKKNIEEPLLKHGLMDTAYFIGQKSLTEDFARGGRRSWRPSLEEARAEIRPRDEYFIFGHAADFDAASVKGFQALGFLVIVSINNFHYLRTGNWEENGNRDVARMLEYGVDGLQIDSVYEPAFRAHFKPVSPSTTE